MRTRNEKLNWRTDEGTRGIYCSRIGKCSIAEFVVRQQCHLKEDEKNTISSRNGSEANRIFD